MDISQEEIERVIQSVVNIFLIPKFMSLGMNASGKWIGSLEVSSSQNKGYISGADYTQYLVNGRPPNQDQDEKKLRAWAVYYGKTVIAQWVIEKGVNIDPIAIAYKIAREGTKYFPKGTDLLEILSSPEVTNYINQEIGKYLILKTQIEILRNAKNILE